MSKGAGFSITGLVSRRDAMCVFFRAWMRGAKARSVKRGLPFTVTEEFLADLMVEQNFVCAVSGLEFYTDVPRRDPFSPSVDRIDNDRGYEPGNVRIVCLIVNIARGDFGDDALIRMSQAVAAVNK